MNKLAEDKWVTILGCLLLFCVQFIVNMVIVALPAMASDLHLNVDMENAINLVFLITSVALMIPLGTYVSKYGIGRYLKISLLLMTIGLLLSAFSTDINMLLFQDLFRESPLPLLIVQSMLLLHCSCLLIDWVMFWE